MSHDVQDILKVHILLQQMNTVSKRQRINNTNPFVLPNDLYISIWNYCTTTLILHSCLVVNQHWNHLICTSEILWRTRDMCIRTLKQAEFFVEMNVAKCEWRLKHYRRFIWELTERYVDHQNRFNIQMVKFCQLAVQLKHIILDDAPKLCMDPFLQLPCLKSLTLTHDDPFQFLMYTSNEHMLPISTSITDLTIERFIKCPPWLINACPNLTQLQIHDPDSQQGQAIGNHQHLNTLHLESSFGFYEQDWFEEDPPEELDDTLLALLHISRAAKLHTIHWEFTGMELLIYNTHWAAMNQVFLQLSSSLHTLNLRLERNDGDREYLTLHSILGCITQCKLLVHLTINNIGCDVFDKVIADVDFDLILSVSSLCTFKLHGVRLSIAWLQLLTQQFPSLTQLYVSLQIPFQDTSRLSTTLAQWKQLNRCLLNAPGIAQALNDSLGAYLNTIKSKNAHNLILPGIKKNNYWFGWR